MQRALYGILHGGDRIAEIRGENAYYVRPVLCEMPKHWSRAARDLAPIPYVMRYSQLDEAIRIPQRRRCVPHLFHLFDRSARG
jgi:acyl-CoA reductase-like NAD-dependent aldehyde dehydrogenase